MTGNLRHLRNADGDAVALSHRRAVVRLDDGSDVVYTDIRRFGTWLLVEPGELDPYLERRLGIEPLARGFTAQALADRLAGAAPRSRRPCSTSACSPASATSTRTRRSGVRASIRCALRASSISTS